MWKIKNKKRHQFKLKLTHFTIKLNLSSGNYFINLENYKNIVKIQNYTYEKYW